MPVFMVVTRLRLREPRHAREFLEAAAAAIKQAKKAPGNLGTGVLRDANDVYWTRTAWGDRRRMLAFMTTEPHLGMMGRIDEWCDEATFVEWEQGTADLPDWQAAYQRLVDEGHVTALTQPSGGHAARSFPAPVQG